MVDKIKLEAASEEASKLVAEAQEAVESATRYVKEAGGKSTEGFYRSEKGPRGIDHE